MAENTDVIRHLQASVLTCLCCTLASNRTSRRQFGTWEVTKRIASSFLSVSIIPCLWRVSPVLPPPDLSPPLPSPPPPTCASHLRGVAYLHTYEPKRKGICVPEKQKRKRGDTQAGRWRLMKRNEKHSFRLLLSLFSPPSRAVLSPHPIGHTLEGPAKAPLMRNIWRECKEVRKGRSLMKAT